ncbi:Ig-like domain-containing protein [Streptomyces sp. NPDC090442]|uniref:L,D-transpeptidase n=1 Tax=Streptomyces sp. NPDC090442 TaxID=3365962 RepID=UPI0037F50C16
MGLGPDGTPTPEQNIEKRPSSASPRRRFLVGAVAAVGGTVGIAAWASRNKVDDTQVTASTQTAIIKITPANGTTDAGVTDASVTCIKGELTDVTLVAVDNPTPVRGSLSADKKTWKPDSPLERGTAYKVTAKAKDLQERALTQRAAFTTVSAANSFIGTFTPEDASTVGVGMPVSLTFDKPVKDKRAVESALKVTSSSGQHVVGHWFSDTRIDFRPKEYWEAGSTVTLRLRLAGIEAAPGIKGIQDKTVSFTIGRSQISTVDVGRHTMTVVRGGKTIKVIPISAGSTKTPTYNGQMVISEKHKETRMDGSTVGFGGEYDIPDVPHAMRLSTSGTFIHGNYWSKGVFGTSNTSHGCIGLADTQGANNPQTTGAWFYANSLIGDIVIVKDSPDETIRPDNGLNAWNMHWNDWVKGSALS